MLVGHVKLKSTFSRAILRPLPALVLILLPLLALLLISSCPRFLSPLPFPLILFVFFYLLCRSLFA